MRARLQRHRLPQSFETRCGLAARRNLFAARVVDDAGISVAKGSHMRIATLTLVGAIGLTVSAVSASATPTAPAMTTPNASNIVQVAGGCGWGFHPNRWGRCAPNHHYGYYRPHYLRPYWRRHFGGG